MTLHTQPPTAPTAPIRNLRIRFWGVQGSCPLFPEPQEVQEYERLVGQELLRRVLDDMRRKAAGRAVTVEDLLGGTDTSTAVAAYQRLLGSSPLPVFGGETTCVTVEAADGHVMMIDGGSGMRNASKHLIGSWGDRPRRLTLFTTHEHLDHRCGVPFCHFFFARPGFEVDVYGTRQFLNALDRHYGVFSRELTPHMHDDDPVDFRVMSARFDGTELHDPTESPAATAEKRPWRIRELGLPIQVGATTVTSFDVYHGVTRCLGYKFRHGDVAFVFCTDHEVRRGTEPADPRQRRSEAAEANLVEQCRGVDLAYFDGQYFRDEYKGSEPIGVTAAVPRIDWGHGCIEDIIERSRRIGVKQTLIGHHDPERSWTERVELDRWLRTQHSTEACRLELAKCPMVCEL